MKILVKTNKMTKEEWLKERRKGIGGSDAAAVLGLDPWKTPVDVWLEKTCELESDSDSEETYWGRILEDVIAREFSRRTGLKVRRKNAILMHPQYPFMLANVDRLIVGQKAGLECKTAGQHAAATWQTGVPQYYIVQAQHYMAVTGYPIWYIAVLVGGQKFYYYRVERDEDFIKELIRAEAEFWEMVEARKIPPVDGTRSSAKLLQKLYPKAEEGKEVVLPDEALLWVKQYEEMAAREKEVQMLKEEAANKLKEMLGEAEKGVVGGYQIIWKNVASKRLDTKALQRDYPDIYEKYARESVCRRFMIKPEDL